MEGKNLKAKQVELLKLLKKPEVNEKVFIKFIKENPETINQKDYNILFYALYYRHDINIVKLLIKYKADINQRNKDGQSPLMYALEKKNTILT